MMTAENAKAAAVHSTAEDAEDAEDPTDKFKNCRWGPLRPPRPLRFKRRAPAPRPPRYGYLRSNAATIAEETRSCSASTFAVRPSKVRDQTVDSIAGSIAR